MRTIAPLAISRDLRREENQIIELIESFEVHEQAFAKLLVANLSAITILQFISKH
jgi:hypothetical protein